MRSFGETKTRKHLENKSRKILAGGIPWLLTPNPWIFGSFPACKHNSLDWDLTGNCRGSAGEFAWTFIGSCSLIHSLNACMSGRGSGRRKSRGDGGDRWRWRPGAALSLCSHKVQGICFGVIFDVLFLVHEATEYDQLPSALHHRV